MTGARIVIACIALLALMLLIPPRFAESKESHRQWCKRVRDAVWAGRTLEQLTAEFGTDPEHIVKCLPHGKGKKGKPQKQQQKSAAAGDHASKKK